MEDFFIAQTNDLGSTQIVNRDGASVVVKFKPRGKIKLNEVEAFFYSDVDKVMVRIIFQELMTHDFPPV
ncbi:hypothetical protein NNA34_13690 [Lacticaseibacillus paracasei]|nr:hypothetical protein [Lacticaseibacillus paracasei]